MPPLTMDHLEEASFMCAPRVRAVCLMIVTIDDCFLFCSRGTLCGWCNNAMAYMPEYCDVNIW